MGDKKMLRVIEMNKEKLVPAPVQHVVGDEGVSVICSMLSELSREQLKVFLKSVTGLQRKVESSFDMGGDITDRYFQVLNNVSDGFYEDITINTPIVNGH